MKNAIRSVLAAAAMAVFSTVHGAALPRVGAGTELNTWTRNFSGVLAAAKTTGHPILLIMVNNSSSGDGCSHCKMFEERTLNSAAFDAIVKDYKFYMVLLNYWGIDQGTTQPEYGGVPYSVFWPIFQTYSADGGFPVVSVIRPDGTRYKSWGDGTNPGTRGTLIHQYIRQAIADLAPKSKVDTKFDLASESGNTVTIQMSATAAPQPGTWKGVITRSGGSGTTGSVTISLSGSNAARYRLSTTSLAWDASDGTKSFTVTGPSSFDGSLLSDTITVKIQASGFDGSEISYGASSQTVTFKDGRVKQSLAEFAAANNGLQGLASAGGTWFVPAQNDGNVLETVASENSALVFNATVGGILTVGVGRSGSRLIDVSTSDETITLASDEPESFGVAAGQKITFKVSPNAGEGNTIGFSKFSFAPLSVSLSKPADKASISYGEMKKDKSLVNLAWSATIQKCTFAVTCNGVTKDMGTATSGNAIDLGLVPDTPETKSYTWSVRASYSGQDVHGTAVGTASAAFKIVALPSFDLPAKVNAYKSVNAGIDVSVASSGGSVTYSAANLPKGMEIDAKTGLITGSPKVAKNYNVTVTANSDFGSTTATFTIAVNKLTKAQTRSDYLCFCFSDAGDVEAYVEVKIQANGRWKAQIWEGGGTASLKGRMTSRRDGKLAIVSGGALNIALDTASGIWSGSANGRKVFGKAADKADAPWKGTWNSGVGTSSSSKVGGWVVAKVIKSGQVTFTGKISHKSKVSCKGRSVAFPASFVAANIPKWAGHGDVRFAYMGSARVKGGYAFCADGTLGGRFTFDSVTFDEIEGSKWTGGSIAALNGAKFKTVGGGNVEVPLALKGSRISAAQNGYKARVTVTAKSGRVSASYTNNGQAKASGVIYRVGGRLTGFGGGSLAGTPFTFVIE